MLRRLPLLGGVLLLMIGLVGMRMTLPVRAQLPPPTATPADLRLVETFISADGTLAFNYPAGWIAQDNGDFFALASSQRALDIQFFRDLAPGELYLSMQFRARADYGEDTTPRDWLIDYYRIEPFEAADGTPIITLPNNLILRDDPVLLAEDRFAAVGDRAFTPAQPGAPSSETITLVFALDDQVVILIAGCQRGQLQPLQPLIFAIAASLQTVQQDVTTTRFFISTFEEGDSTNLLWAQGSISGGQAGILAGFYNLVNTTPGGVTLAFPQQDERYDSVTIALQGLLDPAASSATSSYGLVFAYVDENNYARFAVDGARRYSIAQRKDGEWIEWIEWTEDFNLRPLGQPNLLEVYFGGTFVDAYINGNFVNSIDLDVDEPVSGAVGLYLASGDGGTGSVLLDEVRVAP